MTIIAKPQVMAHKTDQPTIENKVMINYLPHGVDDAVYHPISIDNPGTEIVIKQKGADGKEIERKLTEFEEMIEFKSKVTQNMDFEFLVFYNNRNIRRKSPGDVILAFQKFWEMLDEEKQKKVALVMHTAVIDNNGTDLMAVKDAVSPKTHIIFSNNKLEPRFINYLYNIVDVTINMASNEGFGLSTCESIMAGTPIIANVTGGLQDQMGFKDEKGNLLNENIHFNSKWGSNHDGKYKKHGDWVKPIYPTNRSLVGSPPTPYIFDDRCDWMDAANAMKYWYDINEEKRNDFGLKGRKWLLEEKTGMSAKQMGLNFINYIDTTLTKWKPRKRFTVITTN